ncbi:hypothetical protein [Bacillus wiedmannii]|uniref:hypothetical protein n=1 Tax=Bacillus wiedmannii TaxID=1890302 RepID=UPI00159B9A37|nr:hypothetical protein [Bacillus wiedmannii]
MSTNNNNNNNSNRNTYAEIRGTAPIQSLGTTKIKKGEFSEQTTAIRSTDTTKKGK